eukprot:3855451-Amphidinium_carterae.6
MEPASRRPSSPGTHWWVGSGWTTHAPLPVPLCTELNRAFARAIATSESVKDVRAAKVLRLKPFKFWGPSDRADVLHTFLQELGISAPTRPLA